MYFYRIRLTAFPAFFAAFAVALLAVCTAAHAEEILPLREAIAQGDEKSVLAHLEENGDVVNTKWHNDWMPLHVAVDDQQLAIVSLLLEHGAPIEAQPAGSYYGTPLHIAASYGNMAMVQLLLEKGAEVNAKNGYGDIALDGAEGYGYGDAVELLIEAGAAVPDSYDPGIAPLHNAVAKNDAAEVERLLTDADAAADVNARTRLSFTPLYFAVLQQNIAIAKMLIMHGADAQATHTTTFGIKETLLHDAAYYGNPEIVQLLLDNGSDVNAKSTYNATPLHKTAFSNKVAAAKVLLENGADVNAVDQFGETALSEARSHSHRNDNREMIALLEAYGGEEATFWDKIKRYAKIFIDAYRKH